MDLEWHSQGTEKEREGIPAFCSVPKISNSIGVGTGIGIGT